jgi:hypothetical protein
VQRKGLARQYDQLGSKERLQLLLEAQARGDMAEVRKLRATCPRKTYRQLDWDFDGPEEAVRQIVLMLGQDLAYQFGCLHALRATSKMMPCAILRAGVEAICQDREERGEEGPRPQSAHKDETYEFAAVDDADDEQWTAKRSADIDSAYAEYFPDTKRMIDALSRRVTGIVHGRILGTVLGLDRFGRRVLGLDATTLLRAWQPSTARWIEDIDAGGVVVDETRADETEAAAQALWNNLVG